MVWVAGDAGEASPLTSSLGCAMVSTFPELTIRLGIEYYFLSTRCGHSARDT